jgi:hypothetical protein
MLFLGEPTDDDLPAEAVDVEPANEKPPLIERHPLFYPCCECASKRVVLAPFWPIVVAFRSFRKWTLGDMCQSARSMSLRLGV